LNEFAERFHHQDANDAHNKYGKQQAGRACDLERAAITDKDTTPDHTSEDDKLHKHEAQDG